MPIGPFARFPAQLLLSAALGVSTLFSALGCDKALEEKECAKLRGQAFDLLNKAQPCATDNDCMQSEWPGCEKPSNQKTADAIRPMREQFTAGQCVEPKQECRKPPQVYCKQGLCVHREVGMTPTDEIQVQ
jgi:hypothetical protein